MVELIPAIEVPLEAETDPEGPSDRDAVGCDIVLFEEGLVPPVDANVGELKAVPEAERDGLMLGVTDADVQLPGTVVVVADSVVKTVSLTVLVVSYTVLVVVAPPSSPVAVVTENAYAPEI